jgi:hypothetical protein
MTRMKLTRTLRNATATPRCDTARGMGMTSKAGLAGLAAVLLSGCINIQAPDKPIVIQLDINIKAEVLYALADDAANTIEENADIF